ncbi:sensor histidine kinase [Microbacterium karelineae]|uniref:sensor histidine kinase n=1 Tax=Microbacterium karelineae TaxID=2654283 RepID=UPI0012EAC067|nr:ATP-binding protein [Microbacterium karelineae]
MPAALLALLVGVLIGVGVTVVIVAAIRARTRAEQAAHPRVPDAVTAILDVLDDAAIVTDSSGTVVATSPSSTWLGAAPGERLEQDELRELMKEARHAGLSESRTMRIRAGRVSREARLVIARSAQIGRGFILVFVRDISEQERLQQMRQDFIQNTSHELKTPVGAIALLAEALEMAADDPDQVRRFSERMSAEADRLGQLTGRIMNLSRLQAADELIDVGDVAVDEVVQSAVDAHQVTATGAEVELITGGDRGCYVHGDARVLVEAVGNLVSNAIAYSPKGSHVGVGVREVDGAVEIAVTDQGIGIAEQDQNRIFERFYRADQARSRHTGGTGLGLSIVKHAIQRHGGEVRLWSREGQGSTFTIRLPVADPPTGAIHTKKQKKRAAKRAVLRKEENA